MKKELGLAVACIFGIWIFFGWKESLVRHGWKSHEGCISNQANSSVEEAVSSCRGAFDAWTGTSGGESE
jgi:hypothetical protein